jgi:NAD(P)H-dependent FMN reductase
MQFAVIAASQRPDSQSLKVARFLARCLTEKDPYHGVQIIDLAREALPQFEDDEPRQWPAIAARLAEADALVLVTPEWAGMASPALKNLLVLATSGEIADKPALAVGVSSGLGGAYPICELRMTASKNTHLLFLPDHLIVRNVETVLEGAEPADEADARLRMRIRHCLEVLETYTRALVPVRRALVEERARFPYGM